MMLPAPAPCSEQRGVTMADYGEETQRLHGHHGDVTSEAQWEKVTETHGVMHPECTERLEVPGGWIYRSLINPGGVHPAVGLCFVPIPRS